MNKLIEAVTDSSGSGILFRADAVAYIENRFDGDAWMGSRIHFIGGTHVDSDDTLDDLQSRMES